MEGWLWTGRAIIRLHLVESFEWFAMVCLIAISLPSWHLGACGAKHDIQVVMGAAGDLAKKKTLDRLV